MDKIRAFIETMTVWNWLALIAFLVLPISALNSFLALKSRYKDWNAKQSKVKIEKRTGQLLNLLDEINDYKQNPTKLLLVTMEYLGSALYMFVLAFLTGVGLLMVLISQESPGVRPVFYALFSIFTVYSVFVALARFYRLRALVYRVRVPESVGERLIKLKQTEKMKGWITEDDDTIVDDILSHPVFSDNERKNLRMFAKVEKVKNIVASKP